MTTLLWNYSRFGCRQNGHRRSVTRSNVTPPWRGP